MRYLRPLKDLVDRFHAFLTDLGVSPKIADPFLAGLLSVVVTWIASGNFDLDQVKLLSVTFAYGVLGYFAPPSARVTQAAIAAQSRRQRHR